MLLAPRRIVVGGPAAHNGQMQASNGWRQPSQALSRIRTTVHIVAWGDRRLPIGRRMRRRRVGAHPRTPTHSANPAPPCVCVSVSGANGRPAQPHGLKARGSDARDTAAGGSGTQRKLSSAASEVDSACPVVYAATATAHVSPCRALLDWRHWQWAWIRISHLEDPSTHRPAEPNTHLLEGRAIRRQGPIRPRRRDIHRLRAMRPRLQAMGRHRAIHRLPVMRPRQVTPRHRDMGPRRATDRHRAMARRRATGHRQFPQASAGCSKSGSM